jgi:hypothetical protein
VLDVLAQDAEIGKHLDHSALRELLDPRRYLGLSASMVDRVLAQSAAANHDLGSAAHLPEGRSSPDNAVASPEQRTSNDASRG